MKEKKPIRSSEDLEVCELAREFSRKLGKLMKMLPRVEDSNLTPQMKRDKLSVKSNMAEGYRRYQYQENIHFCRPSRGSRCELIDDFNECFDEGYIDEKCRNELKTDGYTLLKVLNGYIASLKRLKKSCDQSTKVRDV